MSVQKELPAIYLKLITRIVSLANLMCFSIWHGETGLFTIPVRILMIFLSTMRLLKKWLMEVFNRLLLWEACTKLASLRVA